MVQSDLQSFPVLLDFVDRDLRNKVQSDGDDIVFTIDNNNTLSHEIELFDGDSGHLVAWVRIPLLSSTTDTVIYMYYGNPDAVNQQRPSLVWDSGFVMVQHFEELSGSRFDSTSHGNNATLFGSVGKDPTGKIDGADAFNGNCYERVSQGFLPTSAITVELWFKPSSYSTTAWTKLINTGPTTTRGVYGGQASLTDNKWYFGLSWNSGGKIFNTPVFQSGYTWNHVAITWDGTYGVAYLNGEKIKESSVSGSPDWAGQSLYLGSSFLGTAGFKGAIDEVRVLNIARSASWIQTSYNNQKDPTKFYVIGSEEIISEAPVVFVPSPPDKATSISPSLSYLSFNITDNQGDQMNYTVTTIPDVGSDTGLNVISDRFSIPISNLQYSKTYLWIIRVTDGAHWTNVTFSFSTYPSEPPIQDDPIISVSGGGNIMGYNQTTYDPDGDKVTNIYNWYRNDISITNLLLPFETSGSAAVKDYSGYNNNGVLVRSVTWTSNGKVGGAYSFNRGFIQIPGSNTLDGGGKWSGITVEHWIYLAASQSGTRTIARRPSFEIGISENRLYASVWVLTGSPMISGHKRVTSSTTLQINTWYHVVLTYKSGVGMTLYINGVPDVTQAAITGNIQPAGDLNPLFIGWFDYFKGRIDEVRVYPNSLSSQQIYQRYLETRGGLSNSSTIVSAETVSGERWRCEVTPNDSHIDGVTRSSNTILLGVNNKPIARNLATAPTLPGANDNLTASYTYFDPEGNLESGTEIRWYRNGVLQPLLNDTLVVEYGNTTIGETWYFTVRPKDGTDFGDLQASPSVIIQNGV
jgi:hypothetical protein